MTRFKSLIAAALTLGSIAAVPAAEAQRWGGYGSGYEQAYRGYETRGGYDARAYDGRGYDARGGYPAYAYRGDERGYGDERRSYRRCSNGTAGTVIGALAGGLLGRSIDGRGDRALGTILGAGAGALAGHAVEKSGNPGYCR